MIGLLILSYIDIIAADSDSEKEVDRFVSSYLKSDGVFVLRMLTLLSGWFTLVFLFCFLISVLGYCFSVFSICYMLKGLKSCEKHFDGWKKEKKLLTRKYRLG